MNVALEKVPSIVEVPGRSTLVGHPLWLFDLNKDVITLNLHIIGLQLQIFATRVEAGASAHIEAIKM
jgi:hypothetical protein